MSWASNLASETQQWVPIIRINGVGVGLDNTALTAANNDARTRFCTFLPAVAAAESSSLWKPIMAEMPSPLAERADPLGGTQELGSLSFALLDAEDYLTETLRTERGPTTYLNGGHSAVTTTLTVGDTTGIAQYDVVFVGDEACRVTLVASGTSLTVSRGYLGTTARVHYDNDRVFLSTPVFESRQLIYSLIPKDSTSWSDARDIGIFTIDGVRFGASTNVWRCSARSQMRYLNRVVPATPQSVTLAVNPTGDIAFRFDAGSGASAQLNQHLIEWTGDPTGHMFYLLVEDEVISFAPVGSYVNSGSYALRRGVTAPFPAGTQPPELESGTRAQRVFVADHLHSGSFRFSPGPSPSTSRSSGTWTKTAHWIDLLLILMTSSHNSDDGLELTNYLGSGTDFARSNFSSLPTGYGLGMPVAEIDFDAFASVKQRTMSYLFPNFTFGAAPEPFGRLIEREFLRPMGAFISVVGGEAKIVLPRAPLSEGSTISLGSADVLVREIGRGVFEPRLELERKLNTASQLVYELGPNEVALKVANGAFGDTFGQRGAYGDAGDPMRIPVPGADPNEPGLWSSRGAARLFRSHRPQFTVVGDFSPEQTWDWLVGELASLTLDALPNMKDATRGWTDFQLQLLDRTPTVDGAADQAADGVFLAIQAQAYGPATKVGRIAPSVHVVSNAGAVATCTANRYTEADAADGLPTTDVGAFTIGDICKMTDAAGVLNVAAGTAEVIAITPGSNTIEFDSDFNGELGPDMIIGYADSDDATSTQLDRYAYWADRTNQNIGATTRAAWTYGEP